MRRMEEPGDLRTIYALPKDRALGKVRRSLDQHCARFVSLSPFCILGSVDARGRPDLSPRGGPPGFAKVLSPEGLLIPDRPGNNRLDGLSNLIGNPLVALLFLVPGIDETLRVYVGGSFPRVHPRAPLRSGWTIDDLFLGSPESVSLRSNCERGVAEDDRDRRRSACNYLYGALPPGCCCSRYAVC
jgi:predicted pyridoxine 5'-phosphate oxidase superfamily flavin-nucleotide-binding protein